MKKATREQSRQHNTRLVLRTIYQSKDISRADIARSTHLTRPTVSTIVSELLEHNLVVENGLGRSAGGKPPTLLNIAENARQMICVDLGSAIFRGAAINLRGEVHKRIEFSADSCTGENAIARVYDMVDHLVGAVSEPVLGIGIGTPGIVDPESGIIRHAVNLEWVDLPLRAMLEARYGRPVHIANDSYAAALAEYTYGEQRDISNLILIKIGQGIGAGTVVNGQLYYGDALGSGEIGHLVVEENGVRCTCGNNGCLETISSTRAILASARRMASTRSSLLTASQPITWQSLTDAYDSGDDLLLEIARSAGHYLGKALASLIVSFNIRQIVIAGRVEHFGDILLDAARASATRHALPSLATQIELRYSELGNDIVMLGCAAMVLNHELGII